MLHSNHVVSLGIMQQVTALICLFLDGVTWPTIHLYCHLSVLRTGRLSWYCTGLQWPIYTTNSIKSNVLRKSYPSTQNRSFFRSWPHLLPCGRSRVQTLAGWTLTNFQDLGEGISILRKVTYSHVKWTILQGKLGHFFQKWSFYALLG